MKIEKCHSIQSKTNSTCQFYAFKFKNELVKMLESFPLLRAKRISLKAAFKDFSQKLSWYKYKNCHDTTLFILNAMHVSSRLQININILLSVDRKSFVPQISIKIKTDFIYNEKGMIDYSADVTHTKWTFIYEKWCDNLFYYRKNIFHWNKEHLIMSDSN